MSFSRCLLPLSGLAVLITSIGSAQTAARCVASPTWATPFAPHLADSAVLFRGQFSPDGRELYFFKKVTPGEEDYRIFVSRLRNGVWSEPARITLGGDFSELYPALSPDGRRLVFSSYLPVPGDTSSYQNAHLYVAHRRGDGWAPPTLQRTASKVGYYHSGPLVGPRGEVYFTLTTPDWRTATTMVSEWNGREYARPRPYLEVEQWRRWRPDLTVWGGHPAPGDSLLLIGAATRAPDGRSRGSDIYVSFRRGEHWTDPLPLGSGVNTEGTENFAFFSPDGCDLLFTRDFSRFYRVSLAAALAQPRSAANRIASTVFPRIEGSYRGAFTRAGAVSLLDAEIGRTRDTLGIQYLLADWPLSPPRSAIITVDSAGQIRFPTPFGVATLAFDSASGELMGPVGGGSPAVTLHLKRGLLPTRPLVQRSDVTVSSGDVTLAGTLVSPRDIPVRAAMLLVQGRGCVGRASGIRLLEAVAPYGIAGLAMDKRGVAQSGGNCRFATIEDFTRDALAAFDTLAGRVSGDSVALGMLGTSAGGWTVVRAATRSRTPVDFIITNVGPATSVKQQQLDNARMVTRQLSLSPEQTARALRYVELMFTRGDREQRFAEMQATVAWANEIGFGERFFEDSDTSATASGLDSLWVVLNDYDPAPDLRRLTIPMLAFYGGADDVVPPLENVPLLRQLLNEAGNTRYGIVVVPEAGHGLGQPQGSQTIGSGDFYWRFAKTTPLYLEGIIQFLREVRSAN